MQAGGAVIRLGAAKQQVTDRVGFRFAKARAFAERKPTLVDLQSLNSCYSSSMDTSKTARRWGQSANSW